MCGWGGALLLSRPLSLSLSHIYNLEEESDEEDLRDSDVSLENQQVFTLGVGETIAEKRFYQTSELNASMKKILFDGFVDKNQKFE